MSSKRPKYLIETSAVRPAIESSTTLHNAVFSTLTHDGDLWSSTYIRMEATRLWVCAAIRAAHFIDLYKNVKDALVRLEQDFQIRKIKATVAVVADFHESRGTDGSPRAAAEEFARLAVHFIRRFDKVLSSRIQNSCKCRIGGFNLDIDFNQLLADLRKLYEVFQTPIEDCEINSFLQFGIVKGRTMRLLSSVDSKAADVAETLKSFNDDRKWITCKECRKIGDAVIALEQPKPFTLVSVDGAFTALCGATGREFRQLPSVTATDKPDVPSL